MAETSECPICWVDFPAADLITLGPCEHRVCRPCAVQTALAGLSYEHPFPRCEICAEGGLETLAASSTNYAPGWLSFELLSTLHRWSNSEEGKAALEAGGISDAMLERYSRKMVLAALSPSNNNNASGDDDAVLLQRRSTNSRAQQLERQARSRQRAERDLAGDDGEIFDDHDNDDDGSGTGADDSEEEGPMARARAAAARAAMPARPPPLKRAYSSAVGIECPNPKCSAIVTVSSTVAGGKKAIRDTCRECKCHLCIGCGLPWIHEGTGRSHFGSSCQEFKDILAHAQSSEANANAFLSTLTEEMKATIGKACPACGIFTVHFLNHGCHHLGSSRGCPGCGAALCYVCLDSYPCKNGCPTFCDAEGMCGCPVCPFCSKSAEDGKVKSCEHCSGPPNCPSCAGETPEQRTKREEKAKAAREKKMAEGWVGPRDRLPKEALEAAAAAALSGESGSLPVGISGKQVMTVYEDETETLQRQVDQLQNELYEGGKEKIEKREADKVRKESGKKMKAGEHSDEKRPESSEGGDDDGGHRAAATASAPSSSSSSSSSSVSAAAPAVTTSWTFNAPLIGAAAASAKEEDDEVNNLQPAVVSFDTQPLFLACCQLQDSVALIARVIDPDRIDALGDEVRWEVDKHAAGLLRLGKKAVHFARLLDHFVPRPAPRPPAVTSTAASAASTHAAMPASHPALTRHNSSALRDRITQAALRTLTEEGCSVRSPSSVGGAASGKPLAAVASAAAAISSFKTMVAASASSSSAAGATALPASVSTEPLPVRFSFSRAEADSLIEQLLLVATIAFQAAKNSRRSEDDAARKKNLIEVAFPALEELLALTVPSPLLAGGSGTETPISSSSGQQQETIKEKAIVALLQDMIWSCSYEYGFLEPVLSEMDKNEKMATERKKGLEGRMRRIHKEKEKESGGRSSSSSTEDDDSNEDEKEEREFENYSEEEVRAELAKDKFERLVFGPRTKPGVVVLALRALPFFVEKQSFFALYSLASVLAFFVWPTERWYRTHPLRHRLKEAKAFEIVGATLQAVKAARDSLVEREGRAAVAASVASAVAGAGPAPGQEAGPSFFLTPLSAFLELKREANANANANNPLNDMELLNDDFTDTNDDVIASSFLNHPQRHAATNALWCLDAAEQALVGVLLGLSHLYPYQSLQAASSSSETSKEVFDAFTALASLHPRPWEIPACSDRKGIETEDAAKAYATYRKALKAVNGEGTAPATIGAAAGAAASFDIAAELEEALGTDGGIYGKGEDLDMEKSWSSRIADPRTWAALSLSVNRLSALAAKAVPGFASFTADAPTGGGAPQASALAAARRAETLLGTAGAHHWVAAHALFPGVSATGDAVAAVSSLASATTSLAPSVLTSFVPQLLLEARRLDRAIRLFINELHQRGAMDEELFAALYSTGGLRAVLGLLSIRDSVWSQLQSTPSVEGAARYTLLRQFTDAVTLLGRWITRGAGFMLVFARAADPNTDGLAWQPHKNSKDAKNMMEWRMRVRTQPYRRINPALPSVERPGDALFTSCEPFKADREDNKDSERALEKAYEHLQSAVTHAAATSQADDLEAAVTVQSIPFLRRRKPSEVVDVFTPVSSLRALASSCYLLSFQVIADVSLRQGKGGSFMGVRPDGTVDNSSQWMRLTDPDRCGSLPYEPYSAPAVPLPTFTYINKKMRHIGYELEYVCSQSGNYHWAGDVEVYQNEMTMKLVGPSRFAAVVANALVATSLNEGNGGEAVRTGVVSMIDTLAGIRSSPALREFFSALMGPTPMKDLAACRVASSNLMAAHVARTFSERVLPEGYAGSASSPISPFVQALLSCVLIRRPRVDGVVPVLPAAGGLDNSDTASQMSYACRALHRMLAWSPPLRASLQQIKPLGRDLLGSVAEFFIGSARQADKVASLLGAVLSPVSNATSFPPVFEGIIDSPDALTLAVGTIRAMMAFFEGDVAGSRGALDALATLCRHPAFTKAFFSEVEQTAASSAGSKVLLSQNVSVNLARLFVHAGIGNNTMNIFHRLSAVSRLLVAAASSFPLVLEVLAAENNGQAEKKSKKKDDDVDVDDGMARDAPALLSFFLSLPVTATVQSRQHWSHYQDGSQRTARSALAAYIRALHSLGSMQVAVSSDTKPFDIDAHTKRIPFLQCIVATGLSLDWVRSNYLTCKAASGDINLYRAALAFLCDLFAPTAPTAATGPSTASADDEIDEEDGGGRKKRKGSFAEAAPSPAGKKGAGAGAGAGAGSSSGDSSSTKPPLSAVATFIAPLRQLLLVSEKRKALFQAVKTRADAIVQHLTRLQKDYGIEKRDFTLRGRDARTTPSKLVPDPLTLTSDHAAKLAAGILNHNSFGLLAGELQFGILENGDSKAHSNIAHLVQGEAHSTGVFNEAERRAMNAKQRPIKALLTGVGNINVENPDFEDAMKGVGLPRQEPGVLAHYLACLLFPALFTVLVNGREAPTNSFSCLTAVMQQRRLKGLVSLDNEDDEHEKVEEHRPGGPMAAAALEYSVLPRHFSGLDQTTRMKAIRLFGALVEEEKSCAEASGSLIASLFDDLVKEDQRLYGGASSEGGSGGGSGGAMARDYAAFITSLVAGRGWEPAMALLDMPFSSLQETTYYEAAPTLVERLRPLILPHLPQVRRHLDHENKAAAFDLMTALGLQERK